MVTGMLTRTITGIVGAAVMLTLFTLPFPVPLLVVAAIWLIAIYELGRAVKAKPAGIILVVFVHIAALAFMFFVVVGALMATVSGPIGLALYILFWGALLILSDKAIRALLAGKTRILNYCWHSFVFITLPLFLAAAASKFYPLSLILLLGIASANDTGAVAAGILFGSRRIVPRVSPGKTLEGIIGGFAAMLGFVLLVYLVFRHFAAPPIMISVNLMKPLSLVMLALSCAWLAFTGFLGDITFSAIKRSAGIKDFGAILPGHGGILDRIDSLLFIAPWYFLAIILFVHPFA